MTKMLRILLVPVLLTLAACAGDDKYPFAPQFVTADEVCPCALGAPFADGSPEQQKEIAAIIARQAALSPQEKEAIMHEDHITPSMIVEPVLGSSYTETSHPQLFALLRHSASDAWRLGDATQEYWNRTRPWLTDTRVVLLAKPITRPSYPSGHTLTNHVWAHVLSELFPKKREALFKRAYAVGAHRINGGVHYPSDVAAGKRFAAMLFEKMRENAEFKRELAAARAELKNPMRASGDNQALPHGKPPAKPCTTSHGGMSACF